MPLMELATLAAAAATPAFFFGLTARRWLDWFRYQHMKLRAEQAERELKAREECWNCGRAREQKPCVCHGGRRV